MKIGNMRRKQLLVLFLVMALLVNTMTAFATGGSGQSQSETSGAVMEESSLEGETTEQGTEVQAESSLEETKTEAADVYNTDESSESESSEPEEEKVPTVSYQTHVQTYGWQKWSTDGEENGTTGLAKRLEGIKIKVENTDLKGSIQYQTHVQSFGWQNPSKDGALSGTTGLAKRLEGIKIWLTDELAEKYDVYYSVHIQSFGWSGWAKNGELAGTTGLVKRLEAIKIVLVKKGEKAPDSSKPTSYGLPTATYRVHAQTYGWMDWKTNQQVAGITDQDKRLESIAIKLDGAVNLGGGIRYKTHVQSHGWLDWSQNGQENGTTGQAKRVEAIKIELTGEVATWADVYYRVYVEGYGWLGWAKNGETAGTEGLALRVQAIEINVIAKEGMNPGHGNSCKSYTGPGYYKIGNQSYYYVSNGTRRTSTGWMTQNGKRYYLINGMPATGWKYIGGYKYYFNNDGSLCQDVDGIIGVQSSYLIKVNKQANCVTIYAKDGVNGYIIPVKAMLCSTGDDTPLGTRPTLAKYRWQGMFNGTYAQYATRLTPAPGVLFHSITYERKDIRTMITAGYNGLGVVRSAGCIRLFCKDAYWIYSRCAVGTTVTVYNDANPGPFDRPVLTQIPANQTWDPTDPNL